MTPQVKLSVYLTTVGLLCVGGYFLIIKDSSKDPLSSNFASSNQATQRSVGVVHGEAGSSHPEASLGKVARGADENKRSDTKKTALLTSPATGSGNLANNEATSASAGADARSDEVAIASSNDGEGASASGLSGSGLSGSGLSGSGLSGSGLSGSGLSGSSAVRGTALPAVGGVKGVGFSSGGSAELAKNAQISGVTGGAATAASTTSGAPTPPPLAQGTVPTPTTSVTGAQDSTAASSANHPPEFSSPPALVYDGSAVSVGRGVSCQFSAIDWDSGDQITSSISWQTSASAQGPWNTLSSSSHVYVPSDKDAGQLLRCLVVVTDQSGASVQNNSAPVPVAAL